MAIWDIFTRNKASRYAFVDVEVGLKDHKIHDIGALRQDGATLHKASKEELFKFRMTRTTSADITLFITMRNICFQTMIAAGLWLTRSTFRPCCFLNVLTINL